MPCINKPSDSEYVGRAQSTSICKYECTLYEDMEANPECLDPLDEEFEQIGGEPVYFVLLSIWCLLCIIMYIILDIK